MPFTAAELANIANAALDHYIKGPAMSQTIQDKPLLAALMAKQGTFSGGKGDIRVNVKGDYTTAIEGYTHNDTVSYGNPANIKQANYPWKEIHAGITLTNTELKHDGISIVDSTTGAKTSRHSGREMEAITNLLEDKLEDMAEGWARSFNTMLWKDGTQDSKEVPGIRLFIADAPTTGTVGGISRADNTWWRNRQRVSSTITPSTSSQTLTTVLRSEVRQLRRYGGKPDLILAGSTFIEALETEVQAKGDYTQTGFVNNGKLDIGLSDIYMRGVGRVQYDPTLDDLSLGARAYFIDTNAIKLMVMQGEDRKTHTPARPHDQYVYYRAMTWTGALCGKQLNSSAVYVANYTAA